MSTDDTSEAQNKLQLYRMEHVQTMTVNIKGEAEKRNTCADLRDACAHLEDAPLYENLQSNLPIAATQDWSFL